MNTCSDIFKEDAQQPNKPEDTVTRNWGKQDSEDDYERVYISCKDIVKKAHLDSDEYFLKSSLSLFRRKLSAHYGDFTESQLSYIRSKFTDSINSSVDEELKSYYQHALELLD